MKTESGWEARALALMRGDSALASVALQLGHEMLLEREADVARFEYRLARSLSAAIDALRALVPILEEGCVNDQGPA